MSEECSNHKYTYIWTLSEHYAMVKCLKLSFIILTSQVVCSHLLEERLPDVELMQHMHDAVGVYYNFTGSESCFNTSQSAVSSLGTKAWSFQVGNSLKFLVLVPLFVPWHEFA